MMTNIEVIAHLIFTKIERDVDRLLLGIAERLSGGAIPDALPLHHYTTQAGLEGILHSHHMRAYNIEAQTDYTEVRYFASLLRAELDYRYGYAESDDEARLYAALRRRMRAVSATNIFVLSFSDDGARDRMWRLYGQRQEGFSICVSAGSVKAWPGITLLTRCVYDPGEQRAIIREILDFAIASYRRLPRTQNGDLHDKFIDLIIRASSWLSPAFKLHDYAEEREWRVVFLREREHHKAANGWRHYIELPEKSEQPLPIIAISAGPRCPDVRVEEARKFAHEGGYGDLKIHVHERPKPEVIE